MLIRSYVAGWSACRLVWAASIATAQLAILDRTLSARLVRMIGTRAPRTTPALSALARKLSCLARMFPASRSGAMRMSGSPATSDRMPFVFAASLADGVVEGQRAVQHTADDLLPLGHLAQGGGVDGGRHLGRDRLHRGENRDLRPRDTERNGQVDGVLADVDFVLQRRRDIDGRVGDNQDLVIGRNVHDEHVAESTPCAQAGLSGDDRTEQLVGVQAPFHQELGLPLTNQLHGLGGRRVAVSGVDHAGVPEIYPALPGDLVDLAGRAHENGRDQPLRAGLDGPGQCRFLAGVRHGRDNRLETPAPLQQLFVLSCSGFSSHDSSLDAGLRSRRVRMLAERHRQRQSGLRSSPCTSLFMSLAVCAMAMMVCVEVDAMIGRTLVAGNRESRSRP